ncbi:cyclase family protein [Mycobacterium tilburgii]|uniref:cyclase family protein n=1 Tax=Mycobacterium tilburgii TaxID=44467 RepID=UPI0011831C1E
MASFDSEGYALKYVSVGEHTGTHWGAPCHFNKGEAAADELEPEDFLSRPYNGCCGPRPAYCARVLACGWRLHQRRRHWIACNGLRLEAQGRRIYDTHLDYFGLGIGLYRIVSFGWLAARRRLFTDWTVAVCKVTAAPAAGISSRFIPGRRPGGDGRAGRRPDIPRR